MNVFEFRESLIQDYAAFSRSFVTPSAPDIKKYVDTQYAEELYWRIRIFLCNHPAAPGFWLYRVKQRGCSHLYRVP